MNTPTAGVGTTWLITPATEPDRFHTAVRSGADVALLDLEDSVPAHAKDTARTSALHFLTTTAANPGGSSPPTLGLRLNATSTIHGLKDLVAVAESGHTPAVLLVPKVESPHDIELVAHLVHARDSRPVVWALIETPRAIQRLPEILRARPLAGVVFGAADYAAAVGCARDRRALLYPRSALAAGAAAAGIPAIDSPCFDLRDLEALRLEAHESKVLGFVGKGAVHPAQLGVIRDTFTPTGHELDAARALVAAADRDDGSITTVDGHMVGPPLIAAARTLTTRAGHTRDRTTPTQEDRRST
ncbi:HpcH/HpaI aldolase/citrate lyase family protein [Embleya sp. NPDC059237]|uniref:HpcH/HpaI aldolase/citrate lyase family protein n=1 Tax=Embleya sp. NPDC059237 TaxID=3346784 RepID=UPI0036C07FE1